MITLEEWRNGKFRDYPEFETQEGYYKAVRALIAKYGKPVPKDIVLVRSGGDKEKEKGNYGASWTTNANICRWNAKRFLVDNIFVTRVPKGTMAIHLPEKGEYEEEYVLDMEGKAQEVCLLAVHTGNYDITSDYETEKDADNWHLLPIAACCPDYLFGSWDKFIEGYFKDTFRKMSVND